MSNRITESVLDDALAQSFPASDPLPMSPGSDSPAESLQKVYRSLSDAVMAQVALLRAGQPLEAFDAFFDPAVLMYSNDVLFASNAIEGRAKQAPYIAAATSIVGRITDVIVLEETNICAFRNRSTFTDAEGKAHQIDGLSWQRWNAWRVVEERYYDGEKMQQLLADGILTNAGRLLSS